MNERAWGLSEDAFDGADYNLYPLLETHTKNATRLYMLVLYGLIRSNGWRTLVEIGGFQGNTTALLAHAVSQNGGGEVHVYEADSWRGASLRDRFSAFPYVFIHQELSQEAASLATPPDFIFVDGDHTYEGCRGDIERWAPQLVPGGCIAFHDVADPPVERAIRDALLGPTWEHITFYGDCGLLLARRIE